MGPILVIAQERQKALADSSLELLTLAQRLAKDLETEAKCALLGEDGEELAQELAMYGAHVLLVESPSLKNFHPSLHLQAIEAIIQKEAPRIVMTGQTAQGVDFMPALAVKAKLPFIPDIVDLFVEEGQLRAIRQVYAGKVNAHISVKGEETLLVTVRASSFPAPEKRGGGEVISYPLAVEGDPRRSFVEYREAAAGDVDVSKSQILVAIGRGLREEANLPLAQSLADALKGDLCGSRPAIDLGWLPHDRQIGVSGKTVKAKLYLALGISGAFQHTTGMKGSQLVIAINKDPNAPIFSVADYAIVDDLLNVVPSLIAAMKEQRE